jgi:Proteasome subunit
LTIIVGVKCTDGIVIGADSVATSAAGITNIMQIESNDKIRIFDSSVIFATTGAVGYTQRLHLQVEAAISGKVFKNFKHDRLTQHIASKFIADLQSSMAPNFPQFGGIGFGALMAAIIDGDPCLVEFATNNFQPEYKEKKCFFASMGSGQPLADPFMAFVSRVLWKNALPDVKIGRFGLYWVLDHTLKHAPGLVGPPIRLATLNKRNDAWIASESDDYQEAQQFIASIEARIGASISEPEQEAAPTAILSPPPLP